MSRLSLQAHARARGGSPSRGGGTGPWSRSLIGFFLRAPPPGGGGGARTTSGSGAGCACGRSEVSHASSLAVRGQSPGGQSPQRGRPQPRPLGRWRRSRRVRAGLPAGGGASGGRAGAARQAARASDPLPLLLAHRGAWLREDLALSSSRVGGDWAGLLWRGLAAPEVGRIRLPYLPQVASAVPSP